VLQTTVIATSFGEAAEEGEEGELPTRPRTERNQQSELFRMQLLDVLSLVVGAVASVGLAKENFHLVSLGRERYNYSQIHMGSEYDTSVLWL
jgi:hypothetical protein